MRLVISACRAAALLAAAASIACTSRPSPRPAAAPEAAPLATSTLPSPSARADRWQILLNNGSYLYEVRVLGARGDTLVAGQPADTVLVPLGDIDELRLVQASAKVAGNGGGTFSPLTGIDDAVYKFSRYGPEERRQMLAQLLQDRAAAAAAAADSTE